MGALSPSSPEQSPAFRASPHTTPHTPQCPEGPESLGEWAQGGGKGRKSPPPPQAGEMGTWWGEAQLAGQGQLVDGAGMQVLCSQRRGGEGTQPARSLVPRAQLGLAATSPPPPTAGLIYAEAHRHTLIYAAPHMARGRGGRRGGDVPRHSSCPRPTDLRARHHPLADAPAHPPPTPPFPLYPLHQPQPAQHHSTPPSCPLWPLLLQHRL